MVEQADQGTTSFHSPLFYLKGTLMGEIAEMLIDGTLCQECGTYLGGSEGYPRSCKCCRIEGANNHTDETPYRPSIKVDLAKRTLIPAAFKVVCPICQKHVAATGLNQHFLHRHPNVKNPLQS